MGYRHRIDEQIWRWGEDHAWMEKLAVALLLCIFLGIGIYYALENPFFSKPDEVYHYAYALHLRAGNGLPVIDVTRVGLGTHTSVEMEGHQPPLYYAAVAAFGAIFRTQDRIVPSVNPHFLGTPEGNRNPSVPIYFALSDAPAFCAGRFLSLISGILALLFGYLLARLYLPWPLAALAIAFIGLNPQFLFIATSFSNDMMAVALAHAGLWQLGRMMEKGMNLRRGVAMGLIVAMATLTKLTGLGLLIPLGLIALWQTWKTRTGRPLLWAGLAGLITLAMDFWWFWRNWTLYGDPFATNLLPVLLGPRTTPWTREELLFFLSFLWKAYWLDFSPGGILFAESSVYTVIGMIFALAMGGSVIALIKQKSLRPFFLLIWGWLVIVFGSLLGLTGKTAIFMGGGRLLFPAAIAAGATWAVGLTQLFRRPAVPAILAGLLGVYAAIAPARYLYPVYPRPLLVEPREAVPAYPLHARFGDGLFELLGYDLELRQPSSGGDALTVTYYWKPLTETERNFSIFIHLIRGDDPTDIIAQVDTYPGYGVYPTSVWSPGRVFVDRLTLHLPRMESTFSGTVLTGMYYFPTMEQLTVTDRESNRFPYDAVPLALIQFAPDGGFRVWIPAVEE